MGLHVNAVLPEMHQVGLLPLAQKWAEATETSWNKLISVVATPAREQSVHMASSLQFSSHLRWLFKKCSVTSVQRGSSSHCRNKGSNVWKPSEGVAVAWGPSGSMKTSSFLTPTGLWGHFSQLPSSVLQLTDLLWGRGLPIVCANGLSAPSKPSRPPPQRAGWARPSSFLLLSSSESRQPKTSPVPAFKHKRWGKVFNSGCCFQTCS